MKPLALLTLVLVPALAAAQVHQRDAEWIAPAAVARRANPLASHPSAAAGGEKLFSQRCATCHAGDGRGTNKGPDLTNPAVQAQADGELFWKITTGNTRHDMPSFSNLPEGQRWQLVLELRQLGNPR